MSSTVVQEQPVKTQPQPSNNNNNSKRRLQNFSANSQKKFKHEKNGRKRSKSFSCALGKIKNCKPVLPTKFLLGGNINDPLNLGSLQDEEYNKAMNAVTPKSSPIPTPPRRRGQIEVIIPPNIHDPLNLIDCADEAEFEQQLCSPVKKGRKKRMRKRRTTSGTMELSDVETAAGPSVAKTPEATKDSAKIPEDTTDVIVEEKPKPMTLDLSPKKDAKNNKRKSEEHKDPIKKFKHMMDKIVSPVVPQPGAWLKRTNSRNKEIHHHKKPEGTTLPVFKDKNKQFQYGNYNRYYGYRNPQNEADPRLRCFSHHRYLFDGKDILDIGCNIGHITLSIARDFRAKSIIGIDIDKNLIAIARKNIKHYVLSDSPNDDQRFDNVKKGRKKTASEFYPISMPILYGPIDIPGFSKKENVGRGFPHNVTFVQGNYILEDDSLICTEQPQFDVILCLSITKWIHLNWGDVGIKQAFRRMYAQLRPGGKLILEPQSWASYKNKKNLTEEIYRNYLSIEFYPEKFTQYLLSAEVGFAKSEVLGFPQHHSKGFQRPIVVYTKSTMFPSERYEPSVSSEHKPPIYVPTFPPLLVDEESQQTKKSPSFNLSDTPVTCPFPSDSPVVSQVSSNRECAEIESSPNVNLASDIQSPFNEPSGGFSERSGSFSEKYLSDRTENCSSERTENCLSERTEENAFSERTENGYLERVELSTKYVLNEVESSTEPTEFEMNTSQENANASETEKTPGSATEDGVTSTTKGYEVEHDSSQSPLNNT